jgi:hypothetical protein
MSAADGINVVSIRDKDGAPVRRPWRVAVQLPGPPCVLGVALLSAETATDAAQIVRRSYPGCDVEHVEDARR